MYYGDMTYINENFDFSGMSDVDYTDVFADSDDLSIYESAVKAIINHMYVIPSVVTLATSQMDGNSSCYTPAGMMKLRDSAVKDVL